MAAVAKQTWTAEQYLAMERASEEKHEFLDGEILLMAGARGRHNQIVANTITTLNNRLDQSPCIVYASDLRVKVTDAGMYSYPDVTVICESPQYEDNQFDTLLNPLLIVEVLSPSTEGYDRGKKFQHYRALETLQEYVLISTDSPRVERYLRQPGDEWLLADASGLEASLELTSIGCTLALADVYKKVSFDQPT